MGKVRKLFTVAVMMGSGAYVGYQVYLQWRKHEVLIEVTETLQLPEANSESFADLSVCVEGTIRVKCNLRWSCTFKLAMKGLGAQLADSRAGSFRAGSFQQGGGGSRRSLMAPGGGGSAPQWDNVETNMIVDPVVYDQLGHLEFTPALYGDYLIAKYQAWPHDRYSCAASVKHCWLYPGGCPNSYQISMELHLHETVGEVAVSFILEKGSEVCSVDSDKVGSWRRLSPRSTEYLWDAGNFAFDKGLTQNRGPVLGEPSLANTMNARAAAGTGAVGNVQHSSSIVILPFSMVYTAPNNGSSSGGGSFEATSSEGLPVLPGVTLTYSTTHTASGLEVSRMKIVKGGPKPFRSAYHRTLQSQPVEVIPQL